MWYRTYCNVFVFLLLFYTLMYRLIILLILLNSWQWEIYICDVVNTFTFSIAEWIQLFIKSSQLGRISCIHVFTQSFRQSWVRIVDVISHFKRKSRSLFNQIWMFIQAAWKLDNVHRGGKTDQTRYSLLKEFVRHISSAPGTTITGRKHIEENIGWTVIDINKSD